MLLSTPFPPEEGIGNYVNNLSNKLIERGHEVLLITRGNLKLKTFEHSKMVVVKIPFLMTYPFHVDIHGLFVNQFLKPLSKDLDIIHVHSPLAPSLTTDIPIITTFHTPHFLDSYSTNHRDTRLFLTKILAILTHRIEKSLILSSRRITAVSDQVAAELENYYRIGSGKVAVLGNAASDFFLDAGQCANQKRDDNLILYVGRLDYRKGVLDLIESMKIIHRKNPKVRLLIIGKGPMYYEMKKRVIELGLQKQIEIKGFVSRKEVLEAYLRASIFVLPSHYEGLPTVGLEAMACQAALVATEVRGNSEIVKPNYTGLLVPPKAPQILGQAIIDLLDHPDLRRSFALNARELVEKRYTWDKVAEKTLKIYSSFVD